MSSKRKIIAIAVMVLLAAMLVVSGFAKLSGSEAVTNGLTQMGFGTYIKLFG